jgi:DNA-binding transcriptional LysR family regulator
MSSAIRGIDLNLLAALDALLEERNVTRAAERTLMSQPAMSSVLARLRRHFDDELLSRVGRGYVRTQRAEELAPMVKEALAAVERSLFVPPPFDPATSRREFALTVSDYAATELVRPLLALLTEQAPSTSVVFDPLPLDDDTLDTYLKRRDFLVGGLGLGIPGNRQILFRDRFVCIACADNPITAEGPLGLDRLATLRYAVANFGPGHPTPADRALADQGVEIKVGSQVQGLVSLPFAVAGTGLAAFVPERLARRCLGALNLRILDIDWKAPLLVEAAHWDPAKSADPTLQWMRAILRRVSALLSDDA